MAYRPTNPVSPAALAGWTSLTMRSWLLCAEASMVVGLRLMALASGGPAASREARRMVGEKVTAQAVLAKRLADPANHGSAEKAFAAALSVYAPRVSANRKRLGKRRKR